MKHLFPFLAVTALSLASNETLAVGMSQKSLSDPASQTALLEKFSDVSASEFAALTPKEISKKTSKKMSWGERILMKIVQKRIKKQLAKGIQPSSAEGEAGGASKMGTVSIILALGGVGLAVLALPLDSISLVLLGAICVIMGLVFGIIGLKKDEKRAAAVIGTILSGVLLVSGITLFVLVIIELSNGN